MKRWMYLLVTLFSVTVLMPVARAADAVTYQLDEVGISIDIPADYVVHTRDQEYEYVAEIMESGSIYLDAWEEDFDSGIEVIMMETSSATFRKIDDVALTQLAANYASQLEEIGGTAEEYTVYRNSQAAFLKVRHNCLNELGHIYVIEYITADSGREIHIKIHSTSHALTPEQEGTLQEVVDSMRFMRGFSAEMGYALALVLPYLLYLLFHVFLRLKKERQRKLAAGEDAGPGGEPEAPGAEPDGPSMKPE